MRSRGTVPAAAEDTLPLSEIETNASGVVRRLRETRRPVVLTEDGHPAAVLMTADEYESLHERERVVAAIERGRADLRAGRVIDDDDFDLELDREFGPAE